LEFLTISSMLSNPFESSAKTRWIESNPWLFARRIIFAFVEIIPSTPQLERY
jgi:hypothetical protein